MLYGLGYCNLESRPGVLTIFVSRPPGVILPCFMPHPYIFLRVSVPFTIEIPRIGQIFVTTSNIGKFAPDSTDVAALILFTTRWLVAVYA